MQHGKTELYSGTFVLYVTEPLNAKFEFWVTHERKLILPEEQKWGVNMGQTACCKILCLNYERTLDISVPRARASHNALISVELMALSKNSET